jgi:hypothetical protein
MEAIESNRRVNTYPQPADESERLRELKQQLKEVQELNKMLSETVNRQEQKNFELGEKVARLKMYRGCFKHSLASLCKFCNQYLPTEVFLEHAKSCSKDIGNFSRAHFFQQKLECTIKDTQIEEDPIDHRSCTIYVVEVLFNNER